MSKGAAINYVRASLSARSYLVNRHISGILSRGRREAKVVLARDAAKSGKERMSEERDSRFGLSKQSPLALSASFKRIGVYAGHDRQGKKKWQEWQHFWTVGS